MPARKQHIEIEQGATFKLTVGWRDENGTLVNTDDYTVRAQGRETYDAASTIFDLTEGDGIELPSDGVIEMTIDESDTSAMPSDAPGRWNGVWDLEAAHTDGTVVKLLRGRVMVLPETTI